jgi:hypothetical protein
MSSLMSRRLWILVLCILIMSAVIGLASSLHNVHFQPGRPFSLDAPAASAPLLSVPQTISTTPLWKVLLFWLAFVINLVLFILLLPPELRKRLLLQMIRFALGVLAIILALRYHLIQLPLLEAEPAQPASGPATGQAAGAAYPEFVPPHVTPWLAFLISFSVLCVALLLAWLAYRVWLRAGAHRSSDLDLIGAIARSSLGDIAAGREWRDVIIQSYVRMGEAVSLRRGLQRSHAATPREFAEKLEKAGLPAHAVQRLTRLFESVRYGARPSSQADVNEAVACLDSILQACEPAP